MEQLISDSVNIIKEGDNLDIIYAWMDIGDVLSEKHRTNNPLSEQELYITNKLNSILESIILKDSIILYRGVTKEFASVEASQFSALSPNINTAETYGKYTMKVIIPAGSNAFYISAWELVNTEVEEQEEKEVLILPGRFILCEKESLYSTYMYEQY